MVLALVGAAAVAGHGLAQAQEQGSSVRYYIVQQSLVSAFEALGSLSGVAVQVDPAIDRVASGVDLRGSREDVFAQLARRFGLFYWFDGSRYVVAPPNVVSRWALSANDMTISDVEKALRSVAPHISPEALRFDQDLRLIHVVGPRELKDAVEGALGNANRARPDGISVIKYGQSGR
jgi:hypothetical protein